MRFLPGFDKTTERVDSGAAIRLGESAPSGEETSWGMFLVVFMRVLAVLWVFQGLTHWASILLPREPLFDHVTSMWGAAVIFFAVLDLVAGVGLWLATPWGGVIWLFGAIAQIFVALAVQNFFSMLWFVADIVFIVIYFALTWQASRASASFRSAKRR
jgi:hypothetical protein